nr:hypothetical protein [Ardenticatena sp.]
MPKQVTRDTTVAELFAYEPRMASFFVENGVHCVGCMLDVFCTLAQVETFYALPNFVERVQTALHTLPSSAPLPYDTSTPSQETPDEIA